MKKFLLLSSIPFVLSAQDADFEETAPSFEEISMPVEESKIPEHFRLRVRSLTTTYGQLQETQTKFLFSDDDVTLSYIFPGFCENVYSISIGYEYNLYKQKEPLFYHQDSFHNGFAAVAWKNGSFFCNDLSLQAEVAAYQNLTETRRSASLVYVTAYGTYDIYSCFKVALGAIYRTGIDDQRVWPIAGLEWIPNRTWELHLVYPIDLSLVYHFNDCLAFSCIGRLINNRQRLNCDDEILPSGILQYRNYGIELDATYSMDPLFYIQFGIGYLLDGRLNVEEDHHRYILCLNQHSVPYFNAQAAVRF